MFGRLGENRLEIDSSVHSDIWVVPSRSVSVYAGREVMTTEVVQEVNDRLR